MNCKICGAELKKPGELCNNCMNKLLKKQEARNDKTEYYTFKSEFVLGFELLRHIEQICIVIFMIILLLSLDISYWWRYAIIIGCLFSMYGIIYLWYLRAKINSTSCTLYRTKLIYTTGIFKKKSKEIPYDFIEEIFYTQGNMERLFNLGTIVIKKKTRNLLERNMFIDAVRNIDQVFAKIQELMG